MSRGVGDRRWSDVDPRMAFHIQVNQIRAGLDHLAEAAERLDEIDRELAEREKAERRRKRPKR